MHDDYIIPKKLIILYLKKYNVFYIIKNFFKFLAVLLN